MKLWFSLHRHSPGTGLSYGHIRSRQLPPPTGTEKTGMSLPILCRLFFTLCIILVLCGFVSLAGADNTLDPSGTPAPGPGLFHPSGRGEIHSSFNYGKAGQSDRDLSQGSAISSEEKPLIQSIYPYGSIYYVSGFGTEGSAQGLFKTPGGVAIDKNNTMYVADADNGRIQKFTKTGEFITAWGTSGSAQGQFNSPYGVAVDANDTVYVADTFNDRIQKFDSSGGFITSWGSSGSGQGQFNRPFGIAFDANDAVYVADTSNHRIQKFTNSGEFITSWGSSGSGQGNFSSPMGIAVDANDTVYVADSSNERIQKFTSSGGFITSWGSEGSGQGQFNLPYGVGVDKNGNVYIGDYINNRIQKFTSSGDFITSWGSSGSGQWQFDLPRGITVDDSGNLFVADSDNQRIQIFSLDPVIESVIPDSRQNTGDQLVVITGSTFKTGTTLSLVNGNYRIPGMISYLDNSTIYCTFPLSGAPVQTYALRIGKPDGISFNIPGVFTVTNTTTTISAVTPSSGANTGNKTVTITGTGFRSGLGIFLQRGNTSIEGRVTSRTSTRIIGTFPLMDVDPGLYNLNVTNTDGISFTTMNAFTVLQAGSPLAITGITPVSGFNTGNQTVTITGTGFRSGLNIFLQRGSTSIEGRVTSLSSTRITGTFPLRDAYPGLYSLNVTNTDGISFTTMNAFTILQAGPPPVITGITPVSGFNSGSLQLTINGMNFRKGAAVTITNGSTNAGFTPGKITETLISGTLLLKGLPYGSYNLTIRNSDGSVRTVSDAFTVMNPVPEITSVSPATGYTTGTVVVTISGKKFVAGIETFLENGTVSIPGVVSGVKATQCTGTFDLAERTPGLYNVTVINPGGVHVTRNGIFTIADPGTGPEITGYSPKTGVNSAPLPFTITGNNFRKGAVVTITNLTTIKTVSGTVTGTTKISCSLPLKDLPYGSYNLTVRNSDGSNITRENALMVMSPTPVLSSVAPSLGYANSSAVVVVSGSKFLSGIQAELVNGGTRIPGVVSGLTAAKFTGTFNLSGAAIGTYNLTVTNQGGTGALKPFSIQSHGTVPVITDCSPVSGANTGTIPFVVNGTNFRKGATVTITNGSTTKTVTGTVTGSVRITCSLPLNGLPYGMYNLTVRNTDGTEVTNTYAFSVASPVPTVKKIVPVSGYNSGPLLVTITGSGFRTGAAIQLTNQSTTVTGTVISLSETGITGSFPLSGAPAGIYNLTVTNPGGVSGAKTGAFTIISAGTAPAILTISPPSGYNTGNLPVTITGTNFRSPSVYLNQGSLYKQATKTTGKTSTATTLYVTLPLKGVPGGLYTITVRNSDGVNTTAEEIFYVTDQAWYSKVQRTVSRTPVVGIQKPPSAGKTGTSVVVVGPADRWVI